MKISERIPHNGGPMPVQGDTKVLVEFGDGVVEKPGEDEPSSASYWDMPNSRASNWEWDNSESASDDEIVAYWVVS